jgi:hypothetical protein
MEPTSLAPPCRPAPVARLWRWIKGTAVFLIVVFHLVVLAIRNPLDLWYEPMRDWVDARGNPRYSEYFRLADRFTWNYTNLVGCEQRWVMFGPPVARSAPFLACRYEFTDGSVERVLSEQELEPTSFFRIGSWQQRKLEDYLLGPPERLAKDPERPLWEAYVRHAVRTWQAKHPDDPRTLARVVLLCRDISFPAPDDKSRRYDPPEETTLAVFDAQGRLLP